MSFAVFGVTDEECLRRAVLTVERIEKKGFLETEQLSIKQQVIDVDPAKTLNTKKKMG